MWPVPNGLGAFEVKINVKTVHHLQHSWVQGKKNRTVGHTQSNEGHSNPSELITVYPKNYAHSLCFVVFCCGLVWVDFTVWYGLILPISLRVTSLALGQSQDPMITDNIAKTKHSKVQKCVFHGWVYIYSVCAIVSYFDTNFDYRFSLNTRP